MYHSFCKIFISVFLIWTAKKKKICHFSVKFTYHDTLKLFLVPATRVVVSQYLGSRPRLTNIVIYFFDFFDNLKVLQQIICWSTFKFEEEIVSISRALQILKLLYCNNIKSSLTSEWEPRTLYPKLQVLIMRPHVASAMYC